MGLLVEYTLQHGKADAQIKALKTFVTALKKLKDNEFSYTAFKTDDPSKFVALLEFKDDEAKQRFIASAPFAAYREGAKDRFASPPKVTPIEIVAKTG